MPMHVFDLFVFIKISVFVSEWLFIAFSFHF
jgi:hypothetical protein